MRCCWRAINQAIRELAADHALERIYRKYGVWDERQEKLKDYRPAAVAETKQISTLREWPKYLPLLLRGAVTTVELSVLAMALGGGGRVGPGAGAAVWGGPAAMAGQSLCRGHPRHAAAHPAFPHLLRPAGDRHPPQRLLAAILGLGLNYAASEAENYRAGIQAVARGQTEAALALGMGSWQTLRRVVLPQAVRIVIPPVTNDFVAMFKDSSIVSVITMVELTKVYGMLAMSTYDYIGLGLMTAGIYFALSYPVSILAGRLEGNCVMIRR